MLVSAMSLPTLAEPFPEKNAPAVRVVLAKSTYRPGEVVLASIEINNIRTSQASDDLATSLSEVQKISGGVLIENLIVEMKGIERLDPSWLQVPKPPPGSRQARGERSILASPPTIIVTDVFMEAGGTRTYTVRALLPKVLPPSYRGTAVRYHYFLTVIVRWSRITTTPGSGNPSQNGDVINPPPPVETRVPIRLWTHPGSSGLSADEIGADDHYGVGGIVPVTPVEVEIQWREKNARSSWVALTDALSGGEEEEDSLPSPTNPHLFSREPIFDRLASVPDPATAVAATADISEEDEEDGDQVSEPQNPVSRTVTEPAPSGASAGQGGLLNSFESLALSRSGSRMDHRTSGPATWQSAVQGTVSDAHPSPSSLRGLLDVKSGGGVLGHQANGTSFREDEDGANSTPPSPSVAFTRGRTYNIRIEDQILVKFTPRSPQATYYLGDVVSGTLTFSHEPGARQCLEVSVLLETHEVVNPLVLHSSRKLGPPAASKAPLHLPQIQTEFQEVVADMLSTHFMFTIPMDAPAAFATPLVSVQWILRFEFVASPKRVPGGSGSAETSRSIAGVERGEWSMPIVVHAPLPRSRPPLGLTNSGGRRT